MRFKKLAMLAIVISLAAGAKLYLSHKAKKKNQQVLHDKAKRRNQQTLISIQMTVSLPEIPENLRETILNSSVIKLHNSLSKGKITCKDIFLAYIHTLRQQSLQSNCIIDINVNYGLKRSEKLDAELKLGKKRSILHGIPISVKDSIKVKNTVFSFGCAALSHEIADSDSYVVKVLKKKGAVVFVRTACPQNLGSFETLNFISGVTANPLDPARSPGGSSGGDSALVASKGTCMGLGSDLLGSIRFPASSCGLYGLKPTVNRISRTEPFDLIEYPFLRSSYGPICRHLEDVIEFSKEIFNEKPFAMYPYLPFNDEVFNSDEKLTIAYCAGSNYWPVPECMKRAVFQAKEILASKGHNIVELVLDKELEEVNKVYVGVFMYDSDGEKRIQGEESIGHGYKIEKALKTPNFLKGFYEWYIRKLYGEKESFYYKTLNHETCKEFYENIVELRVLKKKIFDKIQRIGADIVLFPCPFPAIPHNTSPDLLPGFAYYAIFNILDCPVGIVPSGTIREDEQEYLVEIDEKWSRAMKKVMKNSAGLPIGLQIAGLPYQEEKVLRIMREIS